MKKQSLHYALILLVMTSSFYSSIAQNEKPIAKKYCFEYYHELKNSNSNILRNDYGAYQLFLDSLEREALVHDCESGVFHIKLERYLQQLNYGHGSESVLLALDTILTQIDTNDPEFYQLTSSIMCMQCATYALGYIQYPLNKCEEVYQYITKKEILPPFKTTAYGNILQFLPKTDSISLEIDMIIKEAVEYMLEHDPQSGQVLFTIIAEFYKMFDRDYTLAIDYFNKAIKYPITESSYKHNLYHKLFEYYFHLNLFNQIIYEYEQLEQYQVPSLVLYKIKAIASYAYFKSGNSNKALNLISEANTIKEAHALKRILHDVTLQLTQAFILENTGNSLEAYQKLVDYYNLDPEERYNEPNARLNAVLLHHIMRLEQQLKVPQEYNTILNHEYVFESLLKGIKYPYNNTDFVIKELDHLRNYYKEANQDRIVRKYETTSLEFLTKKQDDDERIALVNSKLNEYQEIKSSLDKEINKKTTDAYRHLKLIIVLIGISFIFLFITLYIMFRIKKIETEKEDILMLNSWIIDSAREYKLLQEKQQTYFKYFAHDIRGPLSRLERIQRKLENEKNLSKINELREQSNFIGIEIKNNIKALNDFLYEKTTLEKEDEPMLINLYELFSKAELLIDPVLIKPYKLKILGSKEIKARPESLLILIKNLLENSFKHSECSPLEITLKSQIVESQLILSFMDNGKTGKNKPSKQTPYSFGLGLHICDAILKKNKGSLTIDHHYSKGFKVDMMF